MLDRARKWQRGRGKHTEWRQRKREKERKRKIESEREREKTNYKECINKSRESFDLHFVETSIYHAPSNIRRIAISRAVVFKRRDKTYLSHTHKHFAKTPVNLNRVISKGWPLTLLVDYTIIYNANSNVYLLNEKKYLLKWSWKVYGDISITVTTKY